jgi:hypothetical protein
VSGNFKTEQDGWQPEFPGQRPPWAEGNEYRVGAGHELSLRHGAFSDRMIAPRATKFVDAVLQIAAADGSPVAYLADPTYRPALVAWGRSEAQQDLLEEFLAELGPIDSEGKIRPAAELLDRVARRAERMRARLGLDPLARATLAKDLAMAQSTHELDRLKALGASILAARDAGESTAGDGEEVGDDD